ncbi:MAG: hypothetical protein PF448_07655, partial [Bacteroidales bacterium]|nr:hypothetical protein [Bacteroidales bacterium]
MKNIYLNGMTNSVSPFQGFISIMHTDCVTIVTPFQGCNKNSNFDIDRLTEMENYLDLQEVLLNIDNGLFSMEDAVNQNMEFLQNLANTENVAGEIQAQVLLEETGNSEFLETIKLPQEPMNNKNMTIHSELENKMNDFESLIKVYPNPSKDYFSIEYALVDFNGNEQ